MTILRDIGYARPAMLQVAALCYRRVGPEVEILLVTSRGRGHWILPKGWPKRKKGAMRTAQEEAFEEAGVHGDVHSEPIGQYRFTKSTPVGLTIACVATVYQVAVSHLENEYPEAGERKRKWFSQEAAAEAVSCPNLSAFIRAFDPVV